MNQYALFDKAMSRAVSDRSRKNLLARFFLIMAETIGRKPDSEMEPKAESSGARRGRKHQNIFRWKEFTREASLVQTETEYRNPTARRAQKAESSGARLTQTKAERSHGETEATTAVKGKP